MITEERMNSLYLKTPPYNDESTDLWIFIYPRIFLRAQSSCEAFCKECVPCGSLCIYCSLEIHKDFTNK